MKAMSSLAEEDARFPLLNQAIQHIQTHLVRQPLPQPPILSSINQKSRITRVIVDLVVVFQAVELGEGVVGVAEEEEAVVLVAVSGFLPVDHWRGIKTLKLNIRRLDIFHKFTMRVPALHSHEKVLLD